MSYTKEKAFLGMVLSLSLLMVVMGGVAALGQADEEGLFSDVPRDHWAYDNIKYLTERGIITGLPGGQYEGDKAITRYQVASLVARAVKYVKEHPGTTGQQDLSSLEDLVFKLSDRVKAMDSDYSNLSSRVDGLQAEVNNLKSQEPAQDYQELAQRNYIIAIAGLIAGLGALAWTLLMGS